VEKKKDSVQDLNTSKGSEIGDPYKANNQSLSILFESLSDGSVPFYFDAIGAPDSLKFIYFPDSLIDKIRPNINFNKEGRYFFSNKNIRSTRDGDKYDSARSRIRVYIKIPIDSSHYYLLSAVEKPPSIPWWQILIFDKRSKEHVASMDGIHGLFAKRDTIVTWWYFASDPNPTFMVWLKKGNFFEMTSQEQAVPKFLEDTLDKEGHLK
jgi:hypothetical protein